MLKQKRLLIALIILVLLPSIPIGWYSYHNSKNEQQMVNVEFEKLVRARLSAIDDRIKSYLNELAISLARHIDQASITKGELSAQLRQHPHVIDAIVINQQGIRTIPPRDQLLTTRQNLFIERVSPLLHDPDLIFQPSEEFTQAEYSSRNMLEQSVSSQLPRPVNRGRWHADYMAGGINLVYWYQHNDGKVIGLDINTARLLSDIIALLPDTVQDDDSLANSRIRLIDDIGETAYQWGLLEPDNSKPDQSVAMSYPLSSWKLEYFGKPPHYDAAFSWFSWASPVLALIAALTGLAIFLYREHHREARQAAEKVQFVSQVSHELKTPLTNIRLYAEMLDDSTPEGKPKEYANIIISESQRLSRLITNVLNFTRQPTLHPTMADADEIIHLAVERFRPLLANRGMEIRLDGKIDQPAFIDPDALDQILNNLLGNAEKYAGTGKLVELNVSTSGDTVRIQVRDYGPGISSREQQNIFKPFYRISNKINEGVSGTGIGLYLSRQLARLMKGDLRIIPCENGALFDLEIPLNGETR